VLFVDHDQAEVLDRREDRRARSDADARLTVAKPAPLVVALSRRQGGMQDGEAIAKTSTEAGHRLRGEPDLGNEDDRPPALGQSRLNRREVDLGLARAGDAVQEQLAVGSRGSVERGDDLFDRALLLGEQLRGDDCPTSPSSTRGLLRRLRTPAPGGSTSRSPRAGVEQYSRATQRPSRTSSTGTPVSNASSGSTRRSGGRSEDSAKSTTTPSTRLRPNGTRTTLPTPTPAISSGSR
jgi:hypothetical protein